MPRNGRLTDSTGRFGSWLPAEIRRNLANIKREFDLRRDPYVRAQHLNGRVVKDQSRGENGERGSTMVKGDKPHLKPVPKGDMRKSPDRTSFSDRWLAEQRDAVMSRAKIRQDNSGPEQAPQRNMNTLSR